MEWLGCVWQLREGESVATLSADPALGGIPPPRREEGYNFPPWSGVGSTQEQTRLLAQAIKHAFARAYVD